VCTVRPCKFCGKNSLIFGGDESSQIAMVASRFFAAVLLLIALAHGSTLSPRSNTLIAKAPAKRETLSTTAPLVDKLAAQKPKKKAEKEPKKKVEKKAPPELMQWLKRQ